MTPTLLQDLSAATDDNVSLRATAVSAIDGGLTRFNQSVQPDPAASPLVLALLDADRSVVGGVLGRSAYGWLRIDVIWVSELLRGHGHGTALLDRAETIARQRGCRGVHLDTHGFQAPDFYRTRGYVVFGTLPDYPSGYDHYFLKKQF